MELKRILCLSGGGSKGAFQSGAIQHLMGDKHVHYDGYCGVSVGALNAACLAQFHNGTEQWASDALTTFWNNISDEKVYKNWCFFGKVAALWKSSLYNSVPLQELVRSQVNCAAIRKSGKSLVVGAVSLTTGKYKTFDQNYENLHDALLASSSFPAMFLPVQMEGQWWSDGGVRDITPLQAAIDLGATDVDVIICSPESNPYKVKGSPTTLSVAKRSLDIMSDEVIAEDLKVADLWNRLVDCGAAPGKRRINIRVIRPEGVLTENSLDFSQPTVSRMWQEGYKAAQAALKGGS